MQERCNNNEPNDGLYGTADIMWGVNETVMLLYSPLQCISPVVGIQELDTFKAKSAAEHSQWQSDRAHLEQELKDQKDDASQAPSIIPNTPHIQMFERNF